MPHRIKDLRGVFVVLSCTPRPKYISHAAILPLPTLPGGLSMEKPIIFEIGDIFNRNRKAPNFRYGMSSSILLEAGGNTLLQMKLSYKCYDMKSVQRSVL